jgi:hypothetical protein
VDAGPVSEVGSDERAADPFGQYRALPVVEVGDDHVPALGGEPLRDPGTDIPFRSQPGVRMAL